MRKIHGPNNNVVSFIIVVVIALVIAALLTVFVFQQYQVDGSSMQTTLQNGNRLIVNKIPRTWAKITGHPYVPSRGSIVIFVENGLFGINGSGSDQLIKRVIGLPGDRLVIKNGYVTIYNNAHPKGFRPDATMPYGKVIPYTSGNIDLIIPKNEVFVMGDNRGDSLDSRIFGPIDVNNIIGQLAVRIYPLSEVKDF